MYVKILEEIKSCTYLRVVKPKADCLRYVDIGSATSDELPLIPLEILVIIRYW